MKDSWKVCKLKKTTQNSCYMHVYNFVGYKGVDLTGLLGDIKED